VKTPSLRCNRLGCALFASAALLIAGACSSQDAGPGKGQGSGGSTGSGGGSGASGSGGAVGTGGAASGGSAQSGGTSGGTGGTSGSTGGSPGSASGGASGGANASGGTVGTGGGAAGAGGGARGGNNGALGSGGAGATAAGGTSGGMGGASACSGAGKALEFTGDSQTRLDAMVTEGLPLGNASRTVEMWVYSVHDSWKNEHHLYQYGPSNPREAAFGIDFGDGPYPAIQIYTNGTGDTNLKVPQDTVKETGWFHFAMVWDGPSKTIRGVVNGVTAGKKTLTVQLATAMTALSIGYSPTFSGSSGFTGRIDEFRIWNSARTDAEITATMHQHLTGKETGLVVYFPFDEGTGTTTKDLVKSYEAKSVGKTAPKWVTSDIDVTCP
jgi:concanavalin A-like lectin/glucanase superfamily protein